MSSTLKLIGKTDKRKSQIGDGTKNFLKNLYARDLGLISPKTFIENSNSIVLDQIKLSKTRSIQSQPHSITWLNLDNVESRYLLAAKSDGNFICIDMFQDHNPNENLKILFNSSSSRNSHAHSISCIQWYPTDSGMFFTSGMDQKFKVWDTNSTTVVDEYNLKQKIYAHHTSLSMTNTDKTLIALALDNGEIRFIDLNCGSFTHTIKAHNHGHCVAVQWSPSDSNILASAGSDGKILLWDIRSSKSFLNCFDLEKSIVSRVKKSSKNQTSLTVSSKAISHNGPIIGMTYTNDGNHIISLGKDNALRLWNANNGLNTLVNYGKIPLNSVVAESCIQLSCTEMCSSNNVLVPSGSNLMVFNMMNGELKYTLKGHFDSINCSLYNSALKEVYTGSKDKNILVWRSENEIESKPQTSTSEHRNLFSLLSTMGRSETNRDNWSDDEN